MGGMGILELAQRLREFWGTKKMMNSAESKRSSGLNSIEHTFGWRDMYDVLVKWRQYSEPNDPVWWVDLLSPEQFAEGFGSQTPLISGQMHVVRYYPMFARAFKIMKDLIVDQCNLSDSAKRLISQVKDCTEMYAVMQRDFWVVTPCYSTAKSSKILEGTRLTLQLHPPDGFDYSIRTPGTPPRWKDYDEELTFIWNKLTQEATSPEPDLDRLSDAILTLTFYWYNFMPLSRGSAATGIMGLLSLFLAAGYEIDTTLKKGQQPDWEGILRPTPQDFISVIKPWLYPARKKSTLLDSLPSVENSFPTLRALIEALNVE